jgi:hypothetical protein
MNSGTALLGRSLAAGTLLASPVVLALPAAVQAAQEQQVREIVLRPASVEVMLDGAVVAVRPVAPGPISLATLVRLVDDPAYLRRTGSTVDLAAGIQQRPGSRLELGAPIRKVRLISRAGSTGSMQGTRAALTVSSVTVSAPEDRAPATGHIPHIHYTNESTLTLTDSTFSGLGRREGDVAGADDSAAGVYVGRGSELVVSSSAFSSSEAGLVANKSAAVTIRDSRFVNNIGSGLVVRDARKVVISGVDSSGNGDDGIQLVGLAGTAQVESVQARDNEGAGIRLNEAATGLRVVGAVTSGNSQAGMSVSGAGPVELDALDSSGDVVGLRLDGPDSGASLVGATITGNGIGDVGIDVDGSLEVVSSQVMGAQLGIQAGPRSALSLADSSVQSPGVAVDVETGASVTLTNTTVDAPGGINGALEVAAGSRISPLRIHWFGVAAGFFIVLGLMLEILRRLRERGEDRHVVVADHVTNRA